MADKTHKFLSCILLLGRCEMNMDLLDIFTWSTVISTLSLSHGSPSMVCMCQAAVEPGCATGGAAARPKGPLQGLWLLLFVSSSLKNLKCE